ncbi:hypothetical protein ABZ807_33180 [Micromonospora sp. NPDC047548]|uniref:hypothetical protein n=1 Tax=Micromonospora sp. NPDC047548 TaxID=3155624 RepID=UPI0033E48029
MRSGMDRREVRNALLTSGLSPDAFELEGVHEHVPVPPDFWFLRTQRDLQRKLRNRF